VGWARASDLGWGRGPKLHGMQGVKPCRAGLRGPHIIRLIPVGRAYGGQEHLRPTSEIPR
jgi:hypothetical protein